MQPKFHMYNIQKVQLIAKSPKVGSSLQQVKGPMCVCGNEAMSLVLSQLKTDSTW